MMTPAQSADDKGDDETDDVEHRHLHARAPVPDCRDPAEDLQAGRDRHRHARCGVEAVADARQPGRKHMVDPQAEGEDAGSDERQDDDRIAENRPPRERRHDLADEAGCRQEDDVDLGVSEEPEQVLLEQRVAMLDRIEELSSDQPIR